jgi:hypothetical protein
VKCFLVPKGVALAINDEAVLKLSGFALIEGFTLSEALNKGSLGVF